MYEAGVKVDFGEMSANSVNKCDINKICCVFNINDNIMMVGIVLLFILGNFYWRAK